MKRSRTYGLLVTCVAVAGLAAPASQAMIPDPPKGGESTRVQGTGPAVVESMPRLAERFPEGRPSHDTRDMWADDFPTAVPVTAGEPDWISSLRTRSEGMNEFYADSIPVAGVERPGGSFDWGDAGVGVGIAFGALLLATSALLARGRRVRLVRQHP
jgi:hypothetical protein